MATSSNPTTISASQMVSALALVLGRAEFHVACGTEQEHAIELALRDHPVPHALGVACRFVWRTMNDPDHGDDDPRRAAGAAPGGSGVSRSPERRAPILGGDDDVT